MSWSEQGIRLARDVAVEQQALVDLYDAVGWSAYTRDPESLTSAITGSSHVVAAMKGERLVGLARCVSDDVSIAYIQDIVVDPAFQRLGLGRALVVDCLDRYSHVRQTVLLTDDRPEQLAFYRSLGFSNTRELEMTRLNAFVRIDGVDLA